MKVTVATHAISMIAIMLTSFATLAVDAGSIQQISGNVTIVGVDRTTRKAGQSDKIQTGETIATESRSEALIKMADDSTVVLRQNTQFQFTEFRFEQRGSDTSIFSVLRGTARMISGLIGKNSPSRVTVRAPTATIGIRGTDFEVSVITEDSSQARAGVYNYVHDGATNIQIASGQNTDVRKEQTAFAPEKPNPGEEPLQLLRDTPMFLQQGGGLDALIQSIVIPMPMMIR